MSSIPSRFRRWGVIVAAIPLAVIWCGDAWRMSATSRPVLFDSVDAIPKKRVGVLLGCVPWLPDGRINQYFEQRVRAAARLFHAGKVDYLLASGDSARDGKDEPAAMRQWLMKLGVPAERIVLDTRGVRTLDSVLRARLVFGLEEFTLISQKFHNERAAYIARTSGLSVVGYNANDPPAVVFDKTRFREPFARLVAVIDARILHTQPRFIDTRVSIGDNVSSERFHH